MCEREGTGCERTCGRGIRDAAHLLGSTSRSRGGTTGGGGRGGRVRPSRGPGASYQAPHSPCTPPDTRPAGNFPAFPPPARPCTDAAERTWLSTVRFIAPPDWPQRTHLEPCARHWHSIHCHSPEGTPATSGNPMQEAWTARSQPSQKTIGFCSDTAVSVVPRPPRPRIRRENAIHTDSSESPSQQTAQSSSSSPPLSSAAAPAAAGAATAPATAPPPHDSMYSHKSGLGGAARRTDVHWATNRAEVRRFGAKPFGQTTEPGTPAESLETASGAAPGPQRASGSLHGWRRGEGGRWEGRRGGTR